MPASIKKLSIGKQASQLNTLTSIERGDERSPQSRQHLARLMITFRSPSIRSDIKDLITSMDDAIDQMNKTVKVIRLFEFRGFQPPMQEMGELIVRAAKVTLEAVPLLR